MDAGVYGVGNGGCAGGGVGEEGGLRGQVGEFVVSVDVGEVRGVGKVAVEEAREEVSLDCGGKEGGDDV